MGSTQFFRKLGVVYFMIYMGLVTPKNGGKIGDPNIEWLEARHENCVAPWPLNLWDTGYLTIFPGGFLKKWTAAGFTKNVLEKMALDQNLV